MNKLLLLCILGLMTSVVGSSSPGLKSYYARKGNKLVIVSIGGTNALVEYCRIDYKYQCFSNFDTLTPTQKGFAGTFSRMVFKNGDFFFMPGNMLLKEGIPDSSYNKMRNLGYLRREEELFNRSFEWTGFTFTEFGTGKWANQFSLPVNEFRTKVQYACDSLSRFYTSQKTTRNFKRVIVRNCKLISTTFINSSDSLEIFKLWNLCSTGNPKKNRQGIFYWQYPLSMVSLLVLGVEPEYAILGSGIVHPVLIGTEKLLIDRLHSASTYKIFFLPYDKKASDCVIKVRNSIFRTDNFRYHLPFDFEKAVLNR
jgi:hypothetical protein